MDFAIFYFLLCLIIAGGFVGFGFLVWWMVRQPARLVRHVRIYREARTAASALPDHFDMSDWTPKDIT